MSHRADAAAMGCLCWREEGRRAVVNVLQGRVRAEEVEKEERGLRRRVERIADIVEVEVI